MSGHGGPRRRRLWGREPLTVTAQQQGLAAAEKARRWQDTQTWLAVKVAALAEALRKDNMTGQARLLMLVQFDMCVAVLWKLTVGEEPEGPNFEKFKTFLRDPERFVTTHGEHASCDGGHGSEG